MTFDTEQQKNITLQLIDQAPINGGLANIMPTIQTLTQFRQEVVNAKVGVPDASAAGCNCSQG
jgi:hypothetical protein